MIGSLLIAAANCSTFKQAAPVSKTTATVIVNKDAEVKTEGTTEKNSWWNPLGFGSAKKDVTVQEAAPVKGAAASKSWMTPVWESVFGKAKPAEQPAAEVPAVVEEKKPEAPVKEEKKASESTLKQARFWQLTGFITGSILLFVGGCMWFTQFHVTGGIITLTIGGAFFLVGVIACFFGPKKATSETKPVDSKAAEAKDVKTAPAATADAVKPKTA
jgi:hypothetical protein